MSSSKKTTSNSTTNGTSSLSQTPTNPTFVSQGLGTIGNNVNTLASQDPYSFVAGPDPLQTLASANATNLSGTPWDYDASNSIAGGVANANAPDIASLMNSFKNPWQKQVVDTTLAGFDQNAGYTRAADTLARGGDTTFGGSGGAIQTALNEQNIARDRAQTQAQLESQGFTTALGGATSQAGVNQQQMAQRLAAAGLITQNADDYGANQRANVATQGSIGAMLQALAQAKAGAPINSAESLASIYGALPLGLLHGQDSTGTEQSTTNGSSTTKSSDPLGALGSLAMGAGALMSGGALLPFMAAAGPGAAGMGAIVSDRRAKTEIKRVGELDDGLGVFSYRYKTGGPKHIGVMAQEVAKVKPHAVRNIGGLLAVDYGQL